MLHQRLLENVIGIKMCHSELAGEESGAGSDLSA